MFKILKKYLPFPILTILAINLIGYVAFVTWLPRVVPPEETVDAITLSLMVIIGVGTICRLGDEQDTWRRRFGLATALFAVGMPTYVCLTAPTLFV